MKKILNILTLALAGAALLLVSCKDDDTTAFSLYGFNPNPATRGETITFYGEGMNNITSVLFAGGAEATDIVRNGSSISVVVPMGAQPGYIQLRSGAATYTTRSMVTFEEPLAGNAELLTYTDFEQKTNDVTVAGNKLYIVTKNATDYLSDIVRVEFTGEEAVVEYDADAIAAAGGEEAATDEELVELAASVDFVRGAHLIVVTIPGSARSGGVSLYNSNDDRFEAEPVELAQSMAESIAPTTDILPGVTRLTVTGENFGLVTAVIFAGGTEVTLDETDADEQPMLQIAEDGKSLTVLTKRGMQDGPVTLCTKSGETILTEAVETVVPASLSTWAEDDRYKAGRNMTLSCNDKADDADYNYQLLTQIEKVLFFAGDGSAVEAPVDPNEEYACLNITIPAGAADGKLVAVTYAGREVTVTESLTLVKPVFTGYDAASVVAGDPFTVKGTDLDLVAEVTLSDEKLQFTAAADGTSLTAQTLVTSKGGKVVLKLANGTAVEATSDLTLTAPAILLVTNLPMTVAPGDRVVLEGFMLDKTDRLYLGTTKMLGFAKTATSLTFTVPDGMAGGDYTVNIYEEDDTLHEAGTLTVAGGMTTVELWSGTFDTASWAVELVSAAKFAGLPVDAVYTVTIQSPAESGAQLTFKDAGDWSALLSATPSDPEWGCYTIQPGDESYSFSLDADDLAKVQAHGMYISGQKAIVTRLTVTYAAPAPSKAKTVWEGSFDIGGWSANLELQASIFAGAKAGNKLRINYVSTEIAGEPWYQLMISTLSDGWPTMTGTEQFDVSVDSTSVEFELSADQVAELTTYGIVLKGHALIIKSVEIVE